MTVDPQAARETQTGPAGNSAGAVLERLAQFDGPPDEFLVGLVAAQCSLPGVRAGAILRPSKDAGQADVLAVHPRPEQGAPLPSWLAQAAGRLNDALAGSATVIQPIHAPDSLYGQPANFHIVLIALRTAGAPFGAAAFVVETHDAAALALAQERLELAAPALALYEDRRSLRHTAGDLARLRLALETLAAVHAQARFAAAAMALCNEAAARWQCDRVSLGFHKDRYVKLRALSHTEKFSRRMQLVQDIESAMEECLDQDLEVLHPAARDAPFVSRAAAALSTRHGPTAVLSLPLRRAGQVTAVLTLERPADRPFQLDEVEALRLTCELAAPWLVMLEEHDRWFGAKAAAAARAGLAALVGPKHTWLKLAAVLVLAALGFLIFAKGTYTASSSFTLEAVERRVVVAPFDGYLKSVEVEPDSLVKAGETVLATLETSDLALRLAEAKGRRIACLKQAAVAMEADKRGEAEIARAQADAVAAEMQLLEDQIGRAVLKAPISGRVLSGDLKSHVNARLQTGEVLFEIAPVGQLRAELFVPEDAVGDVKQGQTGRLATASFPDRKIPFSVEMVFPAAELKNQQNTYRVRARLDYVEEWMRPGMSGTARIEIDRRSYLAIWTRPLLNWLRMKFWL